MGKLLYKSRVGIGYQDLFVLLPGLGIYLFFLGATGLFTYQLFTVNSFAVQHLGVLFVFLPMDALAVYSFFFYWRSRPTIAVGDDSFYLPEGRILFRDIADITVNGIGTKSYLWIPIECEVVVLKLHAGKSINLWAGNYSNGNELRLICEQILINIRKQEYCLHEAPIKMPSSLLINVNERSPYEKFYKNPFFKINTWCLLVAFAFVTKGAIFGPHGQLFLTVMSVYLGIGLLIYATRVNYFLVSDTHLFIKNPFTPWRNIAIAISEIKSVRGEKAPNSLLGPKSLAVITEGQEIFRFYALSLEKQHYERLFTAIDARMKH